ncbi:carbohydrate ABC transporter substrate-binding protein [Paenibacillus agaridevorans]|uniref:Carbohydrate ABC transporter substrate-binding protein n=1 Tax=Paenibacillus agaridevorans TaxID=171404 RepID=A0A2R5EHI3_9BACL|nr:extracellular solute-binding protein [Paenibacillus agaridevorans]GBG05967.1 carbohydrate ABC transporter substrate-binding protein [Paenibacillus agaridevorans]
MRKTSIVSLGLMVIMGTLLAACTGNNNNPKTEASPNAASTPTTQSSAETSGKKFKGEIVISLSKDSEPATEAAFKKLAEEYKKVQPDVKLLWEPGGGGDNYRTWIGTQLTGQNPRPDIVSGNFQPTYDKYVNFDKYRNRENSYTGNKWDEDLNFDFHLSSNAKNERIMLPTQAAHVLWFYNKEIFDKLNITPPTNWDELVAISEKIAQAGYIPVATNYTNMLPQVIHEIYFDQYHKDWNNFAKAVPGDYNYDDDKDGSFNYDPNDPFIDTKYNYNHARFLKSLKEGDITFDNPGHVEMIRNLSKVFPKYSQQDLFVAEGGADYTLWLQQKAAIIIDTLGRLVNVNTDMAKLNDPERLEQLKIEDGSGLKPFEWGTFENPPMTGEYVQGQVRSVESSSGEYISIIDKNQEQTEMVLDFTMFWLSKAGYQKWIDGMTESGSYAIGGPVMINGVQLPPQIDEMFGDIQIMGNAEVEINKVMLVGRVNDLKATGRDLFKQALEGKITPEEYVQKFQKLWIDNLDQIMEKAGLTQENIEYPERQPGA